MLVTFVLANPTPLVEEEMVLLMVRLFSTLLGLHWYRWKWGSRNRFAVCPKGRVYFGCSFEPSFKSGHHCTNFTWLTRLSSEDDGEIDRAEKSQTLSTM